MQLKLSMRDKKEDILSAYEKLLSRYQEKEKLAAEEELLKKTSSLTVEDIVKGLTDLKINIGKTLTNVADNLTAEVGKLKEVQTAIEIEKKNLEEIYDIKVAAETVANLIRSHAEEKKRFEEEMAAKKKIWQDEQKEHELLIKERDEKIKKERKREEEEYAYDLATKTEERERCLRRRNGGIEKSVAGREGITGKYLGGERKSRCRPGNGID